MPTAALPKDFTDLQQFVDLWAHETEQERNRTRRLSNLTDVQKFYDTMLPRMESVLHFLSKFPPGSKNYLPGETRLLLYLALAMAKITTVVEMFREPSVPNGFDPERFIEGHSSFKD